MAAMATDLKILMDGKGVNQLTSHRWIDITLLHEKLIALFCIRDAGLMTDDLQKMEVIKLDLKKKSYQLKRLEEAVCQRKRHAEMKHTLQEITEDLPDIALKLWKFARNKFGRLAITED